MEFHPNKIHCPALDRKNSINGRAAVLIGVSTTTQGAISFFFHFCAQDSHIASNTHHGVARIEKSSCEKAKREEFYGIFHVRNGMPWEL
jgi:hypothetical protein